MLWATPAGAATEWLAICAKCVSPHVFSRSGIGTPNAVALARITPAAVAEWCGSWQPDDKGCIQQQSAAQDMKKTQRSADPLRRDLGERQARQRARAACCGPGK